MFLQQSACCNHPSLYFSFCNTDLVAKILELTCACIFFYNRDLASKKFTTKVLLQNFKDHMTRSYTFIFFAREVLLQFFLQQRSYCKNLKDRLHKSFATGSCFRFF